MIFRYSSGITIATLGERPVAGPALTRHLSRPTPACSAGRRPAAAIDSCRNTLLRHRSFSIAGDSPRRTSIHSHSIINRPPKPARLKGLAVIEKSLYRRSYRQKNRPFAGAGLRGIGISSISTSHTYLETALQSHSVAVAVAHDNVRHASNARFRIDLRPDRTVHRSSAVVAQPGWISMNVKMNVAIASFCSSIAKCPASSRWTSASGRSRLKAVAPAATKEGSLRPHTTSVGGLCSRSHACHAGYNATFVR